MKEPRWAFGVWLFVTLAIVATGVLGATYVLVQQAYRTGLDDPQIQVAEDAALRLEHGAVPADIVPHGTPLVDIRNSLAPWVAVYDANGSILEASGQLDNAPPALPHGVFDTAQWYKHLNGSPVMQDRFSWQPAGDVRQAVVLVQTEDKKYFVAAGRNMRDVEQRIEHEGEMIFLAWVVVMGALLACILGGVWVLPRI